MILLFIVFLILFLRQFEFFFEGLDLPQETKRLLRRRLALSFQGLDLPQEAKTTLRRRLVLNIIWVAGMLLSLMQTGHLFW